MNGVKLTAAQQRAIQDVESGSTSAIRGQAVALRSLEAKGLIVARAPRTDGYVRLYYPSEYRITAAGRAALKEGGE